MATLTNDIVNHFNPIYSTSWESVLQKEMSVIEPYATFDPIPPTGNGNRKNYNSIGPATFRKQNERLKDTIWDDIEMSKRWSKSDKFENTIPLDEEDSLRLGEVSAPNSYIVQEQVYGYNRVKDSVLVDALVADAVVGTDGDTTLAFPTDNILAVDAETAATSKDLTVWKVTEASRLMNELHVPRQGRVMLFTPGIEKKWLDSLEEIRSFDFSAFKAIESGTIDGKTFLGFTWVMVTDEDDDNPVLPLTDAGVRTYVAYHPKHLYWHDVYRKTNIAIRHDKSDAVQIRAVGRMGAIRREDSVIQILGDEAEPVT